VIAQQVKEMAKQFSKRTSAPDIALFGRMLAEHPDLNIDAASQVAHAISTHRISMEMDFYTAVDELNINDSGAGMMGFTGYDSACFYRYARIDWGQLYKNLDKNTELTRQTVEGFLRAAFDAIPSGKQNGFAAYNPPSLLLAVVRKAGMGWSLANAFERPVSPERTNGGYVAPSVKALDDYWQRLATVYGDNNLTHVAVLPLDANLPLVNLADKQVTSFAQLVDGILRVLPSNGGAA
jgi:CRISPR system Cascade subunit CasC